MDKDKIEMKTLMESAAVAEYLTQLAKGFKSGSIVVEKDGESLTLTPAETAEVEVEARVKKDKARFSLEVTWRTAASLDEPASLTISAAAPKADKPAKAEPAGKEAKASDKSAAKPMAKAAEKSAEKKDDAKAATPVKTSAAPAAPLNPAVPAAGDPKAAPK
jgi:amphi-Trp domain-containing protein